MYPRFVEINVREPVFVVNVVDPTTLYIRTRRMNAQYESFNLELQTYYRNNGELLAREHLEPGETCVIYKKNAYAHRGEIVDVDDEGHCDVFLVDEGVRIFVAYWEIFKPYASIRLMPTLAMECTLWGMIHLSEENSNAVVDYINAKTAMADTLMAHVVVGGVIPTITLNSDLWGCVSEAAFNAFLTYAGEGGEWEQEAEELESSDSGVDLSEDENI